MNRADYIAELMARLDALPLAEREEAISYYSEYFNEAGPQMEASVIEELGPPSKVAGQILADYQPGYSVVPEIKKGGGKTRVKKASDIKTGDKKTGIGAIVLGIFAAPVAVPVIAAAAAVLLALIVSAFAVAVSFAAATVGCIVSGVVYAAVGIFYTQIGFATSLIAIGTGMAGVGVGILMSIPTVWMFKSLGGFIVRSASKILNKLNSKTKTTVEAAYEKIQ